MFISRRLNVPPFDVNIVKKSIRTTLKQLYSFIDYKAILYLSILTCHSCPCVTAQDVGGSEERGKFSIHGTLTTKADICGSVTVPAAEFHVVVKSGTLLFDEMLCSDEPAFCLSTSVICSKFR